MRMNRMRKSNSHDNDNDNDNNDDNNDDNKGSEITRTTMTQHRMWTQQSKRGKG